MDNPIYKSSNLLHVFLHCLLKANHKRTEFYFNNELIIVERGQFVTGRLEFAKEIGQKATSVYKRLLTLSKHGILNIKSNNKFSIITIYKYDTYQDVIKIDEQRNGQQRNNKGTTKEQQTDTYNKNNNDNNDNNDNKKEVAIPPQKKSDFDFNLILNQWNEFSNQNNLQSIIKLSEKRKANVLSRVKENEFDLNLIFEKITESDFLKGNNNRGWKVDFDFIFGSKNNYLKILENKYKNTNGTFKQQRRNTLQDF